MNLQNPQLLRSTNFLAEKWVAADSAATLTVVYPATDTPLADAPRCGTGETRRATEVAWPDWQAFNEVTLFDGIKQSGIGREGPK